MKKYIGISLTLLLMLSALAACAPKTLDPPGESIDTSQITTELENPWHDVDTAEEAAEGAGLDSFSIGSGSISLGEMNVSQYRYMDGIAQATIEFPAVEMTIRKGKDDQAMYKNDKAEGTGDISGDYNEYGNGWVQDINGTEVECYGNRKGEATKTIWQSGNICYSIVVEGLGGDEDYGLSAEDLTTIVSGLQ